MDSDQPDLSSFMKSDVATFIPLTYLLITLTIWLSFRNVRLTALALLNISVCTGAPWGCYLLTSP
jgi:predicted RND superfamily exporter protein